MSTLYSNTEIASLTALSGNYTESIDLSQADYCAIQVNNTAGSSPNFTLSINASNDNANWVLVTGSTFTLTGATNTLIVLDQPGFKWAQISLVHNSGSADFTIQVALRSDTVVSN